MPRRTIKRLVLPLLLASACDDPDLASDAVHDDPGPVSWRADGGTYGGSLRLNTARLFVEGMPLRHFDRYGLETTYDNSQKTRVTFHMLRLAGGGELPAASHTIQVDRGSLRIDGTTLPAARLLGSEWVFSLRDKHTPTREVTMRITGVALAHAPGGKLPVYNFTLAAADAYYEAGPYSACAPLDVLTVSRLETTTVKDTPPDVANDFHADFAATLYGAVGSSETGTIFTDSRVITVACLSGAVGKAGLWGYPPWVAHDGVRTGPQQLQAATRAIRADYCADGTAHTQDGTPIQVRDRWFAGFREPLAPTEAVFGADGSDCKVDDDRLASGATWDCGGALVHDCRQSASDYLRGATTPFMWTKVDPQQVAVTPSHACDVAGDPGCADPGVEAVVCEDDPYCCAAAWDSICVAEVLEFGAAEQACCSEHALPGCAAPDVAACVGSFAAACQTTGWDAACALAVESLGCGQCR